MAHNGIHKLRQGKTFHWPSSTCNRACSESGCKNEYWLFWHSTMQMAPLMSRRSLLLVDSSLDELKPLSTAIHTAQSSLTELTMINTATIQCIHIAQLPCWANRSPPNNMYTAQSSLAKLTVNPYSKMYRNRAHLRSIQCKSTWLYACKLYRGQSSLPELSCFLRLKGWLIFELPIRRSLLPAPPYQFSNQIRAQAFLIQ